ncbi:MAG: hypothetical protein ACYS1B_10955 [Planctomycetota bacterium]
MALARSKDLVTAERIGLVFSPNNKDAVLFSKRFAGRWAVLHRPDAGGIENIWSAYSPDLLHWGEPHCVLPVAADLPRRQGLRRQLRVSRRRGPARP